MLMQEKILRQSAYANDPHSSKIYLVSICFRLHINFASPRYGKFFPLVSFCPPFWQQNWVKCFQPLSSLGDMFPTRLAPSGPLFGSASEASRRTDSGKGKKLKTHLPVNPKYRNVSNIHEQLQHQLFSALYQKIC